jgi:hypothetical protein
VSGSIGGVTAVKLRGWRGVKPVAAPSGVAISTRMPTTSEHEQVLGLVAENLGRLRRADLARVCQPVAMDPGLDGDALRAVRRERLNTRKTALTAESSARWANAIIAANDEEYRMARDTQHRHMVGLRAAIATLERRLAQPSADTLTAQQRRQRRKTQLPKGYASQAERFAKQRRLQVLRAKLARANFTSNGRLLVHHHVGLHLVGPRHDTALQMHRIGETRLFHRGQRLGRAHTGLAI